MLQMMTTSVDFWISGGNKIMKLKKKIIMLLTSCAAFFVVAGFCAATQAVSVVNAATVNTADIYMEEGASVRKVAPTGIRFSTYVSEAYANSGKSFGTLIIPETSYTGDIADINHDTENVLDILLLSVVDYPIVGIAQNSGGFVVTCHIRIGAGLCITDDSKGICIL